MFKNILQKIEEFKSDMLLEAREIYKSINDRKRTDESISQLSKLLEYQTKLTDQLINHLYEKDSNTLEAVVFVPYRGKPIVFKDGKKVSSDDMTSFDVDWSFDRKTEVTIRNE